MDNKEKKNKYKKQKNSIHAFFDDRLHIESDIKELKGSYTIEAALIMPLIFMLITSMIFMGFYLRDRLTIRAISYKYIYSEQKTEVNEEKIAELLREHLMLLKIKDISIEEKTEKINIKIKAKFDSRVKFLNYLLEMILGETNVDVEAEDFRGRDNLLLINAFKRG